MACSMHRKCIRGPAARLCTPPRAQLALHATGRQAPCHVSRRHALAGMLHDDQQWQHLSPAAAAAQQQEHAQPSSNTPMTRRGALLSIGLLAACALASPATAAPSSPFSKPGSITFTQFTPSMQQELGTDAWPIWEHEVGVLKDYVHEADEDCLFLEGLVVITPKDGPAVTVRPGDFVTFPKGLVSTWDIQRPVRKHYKEYF